MAERRIKREEETEEDRRKIPRFTNEELQRTLQQTRTWIYVLYASSIVVAIFELGYALSKGVENLTRGFFFGTVFIVMSVLLWRVSYTIKLYLTNHSVLNLQRLHEQLSVLFAYISFLGIIFYITVLVSRF